jgi:hypothetical protein
MTATAINGTIVNNTTDGLILLIIAPTKNAKMK